MGARMSTFRERIGRLHASASILATSKQELVHLFPPRVVLRLKAYLSHPTYCSVREGKLAHLPLMYRRCICMYHSSQPCTATMVFLAGCIPARRRQQGQQRAWGLVHIRDGDYSPRTQAICLRNQSMNRLRLQ